MNRLFSSNVPNYGAVSVGLTRDPAISDFLVLAFHRRPSDAMSYFFTVFGTTILIFRPGIVEGGEIDLLRVWGQMRLER